MKTHKPVLHGRDHAYGGSDPIPGLLPVTQTYEEKLRYQFTSYWKLQEATSPFLDSNGSHHDLASGGTGTITTGVPHPPYENEVGTTPVGVGFHGGTETSGGGSPGAILVAADSSLGVEGNEPFTFFAWCSIEPFNPATEQVGGHTIGAVQVPGSGDAIQRLRWSLEFVPDPTILSGNPLYGRVFNLSGWRMQDTAHQSHITSTTQVVIPTGQTRSAPMAVAITYDGSTLAIYGPGSGSVASAFAWASTREGRFALGSVNRSSSVSGSWRNLRGVIGSAGLLIGEYLTSEQLAALMAETALKGDMYAADDSGVMQRLHVGTNGQTVVADDTEPLGVKWAVGGGGGSGSGVEWEDVGTAGAAVFVAHLDDIGDVAAPAPADGDFLYWDAGGNNWAARQAVSDALADAKGDMVAASAADQLDRLPVGSNGQVLTADSAAALGVKWATPATPPAAAITKLFDSTLAAAAPSIDSGAGSIPAGYAMVEIVLSMRSTRASASSDDIYLRFNNDSTANYDWQDIRGFGSNTGALEVRADSRIVIRAPAAAIAANVFATTRVSIPAYDSTGNKKTVAAYGGWADATATQSVVYTTSGVWRSTAAITRVSITQGSGVNLAAGTRMTIYGYA